MNERIVCAANKSKCGKIVFGIRHFDGFMHEQIYLNEGDSKRDFCPVPKFEIQGFITNKGRFVSRTEAWKIAESVGQIIRRCGGDTADGGTLYSENLY